VSAVVFFVLGVAFFVSAVVFFVLGVAFLASVVVSGMESLGLYKYIHSLLEEVAVVAFLESAMMF